MTNIEYRGLAPGQLRLMRIHGLIIGAMLTIAGAITALSAAEDVDFPWILILLPFLLLAAYFALLSPPKKFASWGYFLGADELHLKYGRWLTQQTVVPLGRVQHIDIGQGLFERMCGVCHLILHTAGTANASIRLPGLTREDAEALRDTIRGHIRADLR